MKISATFLALALSPCALAAPFFPDVASRTGSPGSALPSVPQPDRPSSNTRFQVPTNPSTDKDLHDLLDDAAPILSSSPTLPAGHKPPAGYSTDKRPEGTGTATAMDSTSATLGVEPDTDAGIPCPAQGTPMHYHQFRTYVDIFIVGSVASFLILVLLAEIGMTIHHKIRAWRTSLGKIRLEDDEASQFIYPREKCAKYRPFGALAEKEV